MKFTAVIAPLGGFLLAAILTIPHGRASALQPDAKATPCKTSNACFIQTNNGGGSALKGISLDATLGAFGSGAVLAQASGLGGIYAFSNHLYGGEFESGGATYALIAATDFTNGVPFIAEGPSGFAEIDPGGAFRAHDFVTGQPPAGGRTAAAYAIATTRASIEDTGIAQLVNGAGSVRFDAAFARVADVSNGYQVFLTPDGNVRAPLYTAQKFARGFTVRESFGGRSSIVFEYRIVAHRAGAPDTRYPAIEQPPLPQLARGNP